jgi:hypothetical protein
MQSSMRFGRVMGDIQKYRFLIKQAANELRSGNETKAIATLHEATREHPDQSILSARALHIELWNSGLADSDARRIANKLKT